MSSVHFFLQVRHRVSKTNLQGGTKNAAIFTPAAGCGNGFFFCVALSAALLLLRPAPAMEAVREALRLCSETIVPSLFPFLVFCSADGAPSTAALDRALSPLMRPIFRLSGDCGAVLALGFAGGYP